MLMSALRQAMSTVGKIVSSVEGVGPVRSILLADPEIKALLALRPVGGKYLYQIETTHRYFPRYVVGRCNERGEDIVLLHQCGMRENSDAFLARHKRQGRKRRKKHKRIHQ